MERPEAIVWAAGWPPSRHGVPLTNQMYLLKFVTANGGNCSYWQELQTNQKAHSDRRNLLRLPWSRVQRRTRPRRIASDTASVRLSAPSFARMEATWNLAVCSDMASRKAISLLARPAASICKTSCSRGVKDSVNSSAGGGEPPVRAATIWACSGGSTTRPETAASSAEKSWSEEALRGKTPRTPA